MQRTCHNELHFNMKMIGFSLIFDELFQVRLDMFQTTIYRQRRLLDFRFSRMYAHPMNEFKKSQHEFQTLYNSKISFPDVMYWNNIYQCINHNWKNLLKVKQMFCVNKPLNYLQMN